MKVYLGGTFDPVHNGHIFLAQELVTILNLDKLYLMPCFKAVHKDTVTASANQRLAMLKLAISSYPELAIDEREINQTGSSYTFESLLNIRAEEGENSVCFVMGLDSLLNFSSWYKANEIHELANLIVIERPANSFNISEEELTKNRGASLDSLNKLGFTLLKNYQNLAKYASGKATIVKPTLHDISSTEVRELIKKSEKITHLVGTRVAEYIQTHKLYK
tara:strand:- start:48773 stop:49432 length:660 start_codon:yes stop_codon:yes gene_type:complete